MGLEMIFVSAFTAGLFGSIHCAGMCGGIASALGMSVKVETDTDSRIFPALFFQLGRISSYCVAGYIAGSLGDVLTQSEVIKDIAAYLRIFSALFIVSIGLYIAGVFPYLTVIEKMGVPVWKKISPLSKHLLPVKYLHQAYGLGILWGWLPCGLTYSILLWSVAAGTGMEGALLMLVFGIGTIPAMLPLTLGAGKIVNLTRQSVVRVFAGILIAGAGLYVLQVSLMSLNPDHDHTMMVKDQKQ